MAEIADIVPSAAQATDRFLVRRNGTGPFDLEAPSDVTPAGVKAAQSEITAARGDRALLQDRLQAMANAGSGYVGPYIVGETYDNSINATTKVSSGQAANRVELVPLILHRKVRTSEIGLVVANASAGASLKVGLYLAGSDFWPSTLEFEGAVSLDASSTGRKTEAIDYTFNGGQLYWLACRSSGTPTIQAIPTSSARIIAAVGSANQNYYTVLRRTLAFGTALPTNWNYTFSDLQATIPPVAFQLIARAL